MTSNLSASSVGYPYVTDDNFENIQSYQYTLWQGNIFIEAFQQQRFSVLKSLPAAQWLPYQLGTSTTESSIWPMVISLRSMVPLTQSQLCWALILLKKFEVSKKLYASYEEETPYKPIDKTYDALEPYLLFAEVALQLWQSQRYTYWLNGSLKLIDTLCSVKERMSASQKAALAALIELEQVQVKALLEVIDD